jgi:hypothetical protein
MEPNKNLPYIIIMFSNIDEIWNNDPVKDISNRISKGEFDNLSEQSKIFDFNKNISINLSDSDIESIGPLSNKYPITNNEYHHYAPAKFDKYYKSKSDLDAFSDLPINSNYRCTFSMKHLNKCKRCYSNLKQLINSKVNKKFDELLLENKLKQLRNTTITPTIVQQPVPYLHYGTSSWKETLIIMIGAIIAIFIVFLIVKMFFR